MTAAAHIQQPQHLQQPQQPPGPAELERRAWRCLTGAGRALTVPELADLAGITRGGALRFLTDWATAGRARRTAPAGGRYAPYTALFTATPTPTATAIAPPGGQSRPAAATDRAQHLRRHAPGRRHSRAAGAASPLAPPTLLEVPAHV